ncbi:MAG: carbon-nitrogen hydrolase family protein [Nocardioidaceae bacterium]
MSSTLRVAAVQAESVAGDVEANVATAVSLVTAAGERGARVVVLPELFLSGYSPETWGLESSVTTSDPRLEPLRTTARRHAAVVVTGAAVRRTDDSSTLSLLVFDGDGSVHAPYDKQHLFGEETDFFTPGDHGASIVVDGWELGLGICYDGCFPEHAAAAAAAGAGAYLCPSAYLAGSEHRRDLYYAARALDNGVYVVFAGLAGSCGGTRFSGGSAVYDPEGRPVDRAGDEAPAVVVADLDAAELVRVRDLNPLARDRLAGQGQRTRQVLTPR